MCALRMNALPGQKHFWAEIVRNVEAAVVERKDELAELVGIFREFGPRGQGFTGDTEIEQCVAELEKILVLAMAYELQAREFAAESRVSSPAGRPRNHMIRYLGPQIVEIFHRYNDYGGRHSVWTSIDGKLVQEEAGPLFEFASKLVEAFNAVMVAELHLPALSASRVIRCGLAARRDRFCAPEH